MLNVTLEDLTPEAIRALEAGRETDELVCRAIGPVFASFHSISNNISAAFDGVVAHMNKSHHLTLRSPFEPGKMWHAEFMQHGMVGWHGRSDSEAFDITNPALAICKAFLLAHLAKESEA